MMPGWLCEGRLCSLSAFHPGDYEIIATTGTLITEGTANQRIVLQGLSTANHVQQTFFGCTNSGSNSALDWHARILQLTCSTLFPHPSISLLAGPSRRW